ASVVLSLMDAAAHATGRTMSPALLQLFTKLAAHAEEGPPATRSKADLVLRQRVQQLVERWRKDEETSGVSAGYGQTLEHLPSAPLFGGDAVVVYGCEPQRVLLMSLELGVVEVGTRQAVDRMLQEGETALLLDLLERVPEHDPVGQELRVRVYNRHTVQMVLSTDPIDLALLSRLVPHAGADSLGVLLDALAAAKDRKVRSKLLDLITHLGPSIGPELIARIPGAPWFVQRNLLKLLSMLPGTSEGFRLEECLEHDDPRVRHEALKILLKDPATRTDALFRSLEAPDHPTERLGLMAAAESCPPEVVPLIIHKLHHRVLDIDMRAVAVRAIAPVEDPQVLQCLIALALVRSKWFWTRRLAPKSPVLLAVLTGLATHWVYHPHAEPVLAMAARHKDGEVRKAGTPRPNPGDADDRKLPHIII
ncbi:MAG: HEAT repeat domain-containing protein, partial [Gemmatimonadales bacterium]